MRIPRWFDPWRTRREQEEDLAREIDTHLAIARDEQQERGLSPTDARHAAHKQLGNVTYLKEEMREMWGWMWLERLVQDVRYGVRALRKSQGFTVVAIAMLALGIGANTAIFSLVNAVLLRPLPFPEPDHLVLLWDDFSALGGAPRIEPALADYVAWKESRSFTDVAAFLTGTYNLTGTGDPEQLAGIRTTANLFAVLGMQPLVGRTLQPGDEQPDAGPVVVINEILWRSRFGADPGLIGRTIHLNGLARTVVGVVPPDFEFPNKDAVLWVPARFTSEELAQRTSYYSYVLARLKPDIALSQARAEMTTIARRRQQENPSNDRVNVTVTPLHEHLTRDARPAMSILLGAVGLVLLIACANLANLLLARGTGRRKELAVRKALGAGQGRLMRQLLTESAVLGGLGTLIGVALSSVAFHYLVRLVPNGLPRGTSPQLDAPVLLLSIAVTALMVLAFGTGPAFAAARVDLDAALKSGRNRGTPNSGSRHLRSAIVVAEMTLTVVLMVGSGLLLRSYAKVLAVDPGFEPHNLLIAETVLPPSKYGRLESRSEFYDRVLERVRALPGVSSAAYANYAPVTFKGGRALFWIEGRPFPPPREDFTRYIASDRAVSSGYFSALGVPLVRGRVFDERDGAGAPAAVIINQKLAAMHWPNEDPIGRRIGMGAADSNTTKFTIVGIVGNMRQMGLDAAAEPEMYFALDQAGLSATFLWPHYLVVRTKGDPLTLSASVRRAVWDVDPDQPVSSIRSMDQMLDADLLNRNTQMTLVSAFAALALLMATIGLYGVLSYTVAQRTREIGVRMALGAQRSTVLIDVVRSALSLAALGGVLGLAGAFAVTRLLTSWLFSVSPGDPTTFGAAALLLGVMALLASYVPARRSASVDPASVLRAE